MLKNNKNLNFLFLGQLISFTGDSIYMIALPWLILDITNSSTTTALITMSSYLPTLIFGIFIGGIVDKFTYKNGCTKLFKRLFHFFVQHLHHDIIFTKYLSRHSISQYS